MIRSLTSRSRLLSSAVTRRNYRTTSKTGLEWSERGHDITMESLMVLGDRPKIIIEGHSPTGFDVVHMVKKIDTNDQTESGALHVNGSLWATPFGGFLWKVESPEDVTLESVLAPIRLQQPQIEYLFIGCEDRTPIPALDEIKQTLAQQHNCVVEQMSLSNAIGTFNILNAEDRQVAVALILDREGL